MSYVERLRDEHRARQIKFFIPTKQIIKIPRRKPKVDPDFVMIRSIRNVVYRHYHIHHSRTKTNRLIANYMTYYICMNVYSFTCVKIAKCLKVNHTTVTKGRKNFIEQMKTDIVLVRHLRDVRFKLNDNS